MGKWSLAALTAGLVILADQASKIAVVKALADVYRIKVIPGFFDLVYTLNTGVAFGMLAGEHSGLRIALLSATALAALGAIIYFLVTAGPDEKMFIFGLSLVGGGAIGNAVDRLRIGAVIDFLDVYVGDFHWPAFNVADAAITIGVGLIMIYLWKNRHTLDQR